MVDPTNSGVESPLAGSWLYRLIAGRKAKVLIARQCQISARQVPIVKV